MKRWSRCRASGRSARLRNRLAYWSCTAWVRECTARPWLDDYFSRVNQISQNWRQMSTSLLCCIHVSQLWACPSSRRIGHMLRQE